MKIQRIFMLGLMFILFTISCNKDDDNDQTTLLPIEERNEVDDKAIEQYLKEHYFNEKGKTTKFSESSTDDDNYTPLWDLAKKDKSGFWYVINPNVKTPGGKVTNNTEDKILLQYELLSFYAKKDKEGKIYFTPTTVFSTINTTGTPDWNPGFYYMEKNREKTAKLNEVRGFIDGIKYFNATNRDKNALPAVNFQGLIIMPSRLAFGREYNNITTGVDNCIIVNFELYKVEKRK